ncbi:SO_0444 family Cu/Zn efflux transporter [Draconibacterium halophilum]|uniref:SO_0444 family Cu/Zn efflux transporter n=1 Tax=Draconibacterium halophilum TaxID=2706887 RepID=A0A6C0RCQ2_9BACT|nr:SO_0444 family Cu/Zn efflux transporter [Draconibacterium halophilum]QIA07889.1 SO_0444 family Cu/Zn efflux transporter [Draconibacterium halophilum]
MEYIQQYIGELWYLVMEMAPWLLLGLTFAGIFKVYFPQKHIDRYLGKSNFKSALNASLLGIPMPLCSCGVIPTGISFFKNGASKGASNSFLISTPQTGVDSIFATYSMLGWPFAILRPIVAFVTGIAGGVLTNVFVKDKPEPKSTFPFANLSIDVATVKGEETCDDDSCGCHDDEKIDNRHALVRVADYAFIEMLQDIAKWLILGFLLAALISVVLPDDFFGRFQGLGMVEILVVLLASVPIYICATGSIPIAAVLLIKGVSPGAALVFLMAGPATNVATITVLGKTMGRKSLIVYLATIIGGAVFFGWLTNLLIPADFLLSKVAMLHDGAHEHEVLPKWLQWSSSVLLIGSMLLGYFLKDFFKKRRIAQSTGETFRVEGMTCSHCEANVVRNLQKIKGVKSVVADNKSNTVKISGSGYKTDKVKEIVNELGYRFIG